MNNEKYEEKKILLRKEKIKKTILFILAITIFFSIIVGGFLEYTKNQQPKDIQTGYDQCISSIMEKAITCDLIPINYNNKTIDLIAVDCLD